MTTHLQVVLRKRMSGAATPPPRIISRRGQGLFYTFGGEVGRGALRKITSKQHRTSASLGFHPTPPKCDVCHCGLPTNGHTSYPSRHSIPSRFVSSLRKAPTASPVHVRSVTGPSDLHKVAGHTGDEYKMSLGSS